MPSFILGNRSGGDLIVSGNPWSGQLVPKGGIQLRLDKNASGYVYVGLSGGITVNSGGYFLSGFSGGMDGMQLGPGDAYWIPAIGKTASGAFNVYVTGDAGTSGQTRIYYEMY